MSPTPEQLQRLTLSRRVLRAKVGELESVVRSAEDGSSGLDRGSLWLLADLALLASVLADVIECLESLDATSP